MIIHTSDSNSVQRTRAHPSCEMRLRAFGSYSMDSAAACRVVAALRLRQQTWHDVAHSHQRLPRFPISLDCQALFAGTPCALDTVLDRSHVLHISLKCLSSTSRVLWFYSEEHMPLDFPTTY